MNEHCDLTVIFGDAVMRKFIGTLPCGSTCKVGKLICSFMVSAMVGLVMSASPLLAHDGNHDDGKGIGNSAPAGIGGNGPWDFRNMKLLSRLPLADIGGGPENVLGNDLWGWTDSQTGREYAIFGLTNGTSFIDITNPTAPLYLGKLPTHTGNKTWRDIKVYNNHAYIVSDANGAHGLQIFDLTELRDTNGNGPVTFSATAHYGGFDRAHNIAINESTGFAYVVGSEKASGGLHVLNLSNPLAPVHVGNFAADGYTHDTQVVIYQGPDANFVGREIAFSSNENTITLADVTDKSNMSMISRTGYENHGYTHQGWLSEDHRFFFVNDELDERNADSPINTITRIFNVEDLANPFLLAEHHGVEMTIDHNLYVHEGLIYQANYTSGLRVLQMDDIENGILSELAFFDTYNTDNNLSFNGAWSVYPFFGSGSIIVSDRQNGLFILRLNVVPEPSMGFVAGLIMFTVGLRRTRRKRN